MRSLRRGGDDMMSHITTYRRSFCSSDPSGSCPRPNRHRTATRRRSAILMARMHRFCTLIRPTDRIPAAHLSHRLQVKVSCCRVCVRSLFWWGETRNIDRCSREVQNKREKKLMRTHKIIEQREAERLRRPRINETPTKVTSIELRGLESKIARKSFLTMFYVV